MNNNEDILKDKFIGTILGVAIGDALGAPVEGFSKEEIRKRYKLIDNYVPADNNKINDIELGGYTDDTYMTLDTIEALVENGFFDIHSIVDKFLKWFNGNPIGIGSTTYHSLYLIDKGYSYEEASKMAYTEFSAGNGTAMRISPIPLFDYKKGIEQVVQDTIDASIITHYHPEAIAGAVATSLVIYHNLRYHNKDKVLDFLIKNKEFIHNEKILDTITSVLELDEIELTNDGYIVETLKSCLWIFLNTTNFSDAVIKAVNLGNDTDTVGAIVGSFAGSYYGYSSIEKHFITGLKDYKKIIQLSEKLYEVSILDKLYFEEDGQK